MITRTGNDTDDIESIISALNDQFDQSALMNFFPIQAAGILPITITDGGSPGNTYTGTFRHGLGYKPAYRAFYRNNVQYFPLPFSDWLTGGGATIWYDIRAYVDEEFFYATMFFHSSPSSPPFYDPGTIFNVYYYIFTTPMP